MKKKFTFLIAALMLLTMITQPMKVMGQTTSTVNASKITSSSETWTGSEGESWSVSVDGGATNQNVTNGYAQVGTKNSPSTSITFSTSGITGTITSIVVDCAAYQGSATISANVNNSAFGTQGQSVPSWSSNAGGSVSFTNSNGASGSIVITMTNGSNGRAMYIKSIAVTYTTGGGGDTPSISADDVDIAYNDEEGSIMYEIENYVAGTMAATTTAEWISNFTYDQVDEVGEVGFTTTANTLATDRTATVTLTYTYNTNETITKNVTVTQTRAPMTIAAVRAQGTGSVFTKGVVTSYDGNQTAYIQDATAAICVYGNNSYPLGSLNVGDEITVSGTLSTYNGLLEITNPTVLLVSSGNTVTPVVKTIAEINSDYSGNKALQGMLVKIENATVTVISGANTTISQTISGTTSTITVRNISSSVEYAVNDVFTELTGNIGAYNAAQIVNPTNVQVQQSTDPEINTTVGDDLAYNATTGSITYEIENYVAGTLTATTTATWISDFSVNQVEEIGEVTFNVTTNTAFENRSAVVTLTYTYGDNETTTVDVTIIQLSAPSITVTPATVTVAAAGDYPEFGITYASLPITDEGDFAVEFFESNGTTTTTQPTWISDYEITAGTTDYVLTVAVEENTGAQRIAYLKVFAYNDNLEEVYSNLITITQSAPAQTTIDLRGTTDAVSFNAGAFTSSGSGYQSYNNVTYTGSNNVEYSGWKLNNVMHSGNNMQMRKSDGSVEMPAILTDYGCTITVSAETNNVSVNNGEESGTNTLTTTDTNAEVTIAAGSVYAVISTITITPTPAPAVYDLTVSQLDEHINAIYVFDANDDTEPLIADGLAGTAEVNNGITIHVSPDVANGYLLQSLSVKDADDNDVQTTYDDEGEYYYFLMPSSNVTITATAVQAPATDDYKLFSGNLVEGDYIIYYNGYALKNEKLGTSDRLSYETVNPDDNNVIATADATIVWHIAPSATTGYWTIYSADANAYAASTGTKNQAQMLASGTDGKALWSVSGTSTYEFVNKNNDESNVNKNLRNNGTNGFACYSAQTGGALSLYYKVENYTMHIDGCGTSTESNTGYYLIASPIRTVTPSTENYIINDGDSNYDLYRFNQSADAEWENWKQAGDHNHFNIECGKGYLYANANDVDLAFSGQRYYGNGEITLTYDEDAPRFAGWNLVGNPFTEPASLDAPFFIMNADRNGLIAGTGNIPAMEGVFVYANEEGMNVTFIPSRGSKSADNSNVVLNIIGRNDNVIDRVIVRFDEGETLPKFTLREDNTKIYIPMEDNDYAVVRGEGKGTMPVNFKAKEMGKYTISVDTKGLDMSYLHLIDRLTGEDVNLLMDNEYSFIASKKDNEARFILSFTENGHDAESEETFAFQNGSEIIVNGEGELQVFDVTGRKVMSAMVNGVETINGLESGVYVFRMVGNDVKTQKIVVR